jgi:dihydropteroate synthase
MAGVWHCGSHELPLERTLIMGVLNVTPDSFSDGGRYHDDPAVAIAHGRQMSLDGAALIDVGGESTRPGAAAVTPAEENRRVEPVVRTLSHDFGLVVSVDTRHAEVARSAVTAGASVINDISGFGDPAMVEVAARCDAGLVVMHMRGEPGTMQHTPEYGDVVVEVIAYLGARAAHLEAVGVAPERIMLDPGIGFGKTLEHNLALLRAIPEIGALGYPVLVGASRKSMLGALLDEPDPLKRLEGSLAVAAWAAMHGAAAVRVHDVAETVRLFRTWRALEGEAR